MQYIGRIVQIIFKPSTILFGVFLFALVGRFVFNKRSMNCLDIILKYSLCFRKKSGKISILSILLYFIMPLFLALAVAQIRIIDEQAINIVTIIVSILTSMFFTLLTLVIDLKSRCKDETEKNANIAFINCEVLKEIYYSIMFEILISITVLIMCFVNLFSAEFSMLQSVVIYYLVFLILVNLFVVLKRIFKVIYNGMLNT